MAYGLTKILILENEPGTQNVTRLSLEALGGFRTWVCSDGHQVLNVLQFHRPDMIILDQNMHEDIQANDESSAYWMVQQVFHDNPVPTVFMTSRPINKSLNDLTKAGAIAIISKPFDPVTLSIQIENIWKSWHMAV